MRSLKLIIIMNSSYILSYIVSALNEAPIFKFADFSIEMYTVKPPNNGHIGGRSLVHCREVCPYLGGSLASHAPQS